MVPHMRRRLITFFLFLPLLFSAVTGDVVLSVSSGSSPDEKLSYHLPAHTHDADIEIRSFHDDTSHFHETVESLVAISLTVPEYSSGFLFFYSDTSPVRRLYPLLRPPLPSMV